MSTIMFKTRVKENKVKQAKWLKNQVITEIPMKCIKIKEPIHKFAYVNFSREIERLKEYDVEKIINLIVIKRESNTTYSLVSGLKAYHLARALHQKSVYAVVVDYDRTEHCKQLGLTDTIRYGWRNPNSIIIQQRFIDNGVNENKIQRCIDYYYKYGKMDKPVILRDRLCLDGYSRLVASQHLMLDKVFVLYI